MDFWVSDWFRALHGSRQLLAFSNALTALRRTPPSLSSQRARRAWAQKRSRKGGGPKRFQGNEGFRKVMFNSIWFLLLKLIIQPSIIIEDIQELFQILGWIRGLLTLVGVISTLTSSTAEGGGGSFKDRKPIGGVACCDASMAEQIHWWIERWLECRPIYLSISLPL